jgi:hypothetical protein
MAQQAQLRNILSISAGASAAPQSTLVVEIPGSEIRKTIPKLVDYVLENLVTAENKYAADLVRGQMTSQQGYHITVDGSNPGKKLYDTQAKPVGGTDSRMLSVVVASNEENGGSIDRYVQ